MQQNLRSILFKESLEKYSLLFTWKSKKIFNPPILGSLTVHCSHKVNKALSVYTLGRNTNPTFAEVQGVQSIIAKLLQKVAKNFVQTALQVSWYEYSVYQAFCPKICQI